MARLRICRPIGAASCTGCVLLLSFARLQAGEIVQHFPAEKPAASLRTQWRVSWGTESHAGGSEVLFIKEAFFKREQLEPEIKVLGDCRLAEIFVAYNDGTRIYDISGHTFSLAALDASALGPACIKPGVIYNHDGGKAAIGFVAVEVHDGHIRWMNASETVRRGQSIILWSVLHAANYRYIILYEFRDDGSIGFRLGATAHNMKASDADGTVHLHTGWWRINPELGNGTNTIISTVSLDSTVSKLLVKDHLKETRIRCEADRFTRFRVTSTTALNTHDPAHAISYELIPVQLGSARFRGVGEQFTQHDFWITRRKATPEALRPRNLDTLENGELIANRAVSLWYQASVLHVPRDEDFGNKGSNPDDGVAITAWSGCDLRPRNFFSNTPLYP
jgi:hypothetical protein